MMNYRQTIVGTAIALAVGVGAARAQCDIEVRLGQELASQREMLAGIYSEVRRDVRRLRKSAEILKRYGRDDACIAIVDAIRTIARNPAAASETLKTAKANDGPTSSDDQSATAPAPAGAKQPKADQEMPSSPESKPRKVETERLIDEQTKKRLASAKSISDFGGMIRADEIVGADVLGPKGEEFGEVSDIILGDDSKPTYALIAFGGFLGFGEDVVAIPFEKLMVSVDRTAFFVPMTEADLEGAPKFKRNRFDWLRDKRWRAQLDKYFADQ